MLYKELEKGVSIIIPTWNNRPYLELCINSIFETTKHPVEIVVHVNEGTDDTEDFLVKNKIKYTKTDKNIGVCASVNKARKLCTKSILMYFNDDMVALPEWYNRLIDFAKLYNLPNNTWLSSTMIEPTGTRQCMLAPYDYGTDIHNNFDYDKLLSDLPKLRTIKEHKKGTRWPPTLLHKKYWDMVGGFSEEFFPGFGSDPDLAKKLWDIGFRNFIGVGDSLVYHFQCKTTSKVSPGNSGEIFFKKHGIYINDFVRDVLHRGEPWGK